MDSSLCKRTIHPERKYNISESARLLGVDRWTVYSYMRKFPHRLKASKEEGKSRQFISGSQLANFKRQGFPKKGRKRNN